MYQLLLVDDEEDVLEAIQEAMPWERYGVRLAGVCKNALEALEQMRRSPPDLVVTDVKMPVMNGIEMIRRAREMGVDAEFIVLSGFDEFEFAKSAMSLGVRYYLLKPCSEEELAGALLRAEEDCKNRRLALQALRAKAKMWKELSSFLLPLLWKLPEDDPTPGMFDTLLEEGQQLYLAAFQAASPAGFSASLQAEAENPDCSLLFPLIELEHQICAVCLCSTGIPQDAILSSAADQLGVSVPGRLLPTSFRLLRAVVEQLGGIPRRMLSPGQNPFCISESALLEEDVGLMSALEAAADRGRDETAALLRQTVQEGGRSRALVAGMKLLLKRQGNPARLTELFNQLYETPSSGDFLTAFADALADSGGKRAEGRHHFVEDILDYVDGHLDDSGLSLKWVSSELVYRNEDYVGKAFSAYTGENFLSYLNRKRMERAKFLLSTLGDDKIYTVAEQIGLGHNPRYFSKLFKKHTGMSPKEYRALHRGEDR